MKFRYLIYSILLFHKSVLADQLLCKPETSSVATFSDFAVQKAIQSSFYDKAFKYELNEKKISIYVGENFNHQMIGRIDDLVYEDNQIIKTKIVDTFNSYKPVKSTLTFTINPNYTFSMQVFLSGVADGFEETTFYGNCTTSNPDERIVSNTIDEIKKICSDLGFKIGTEKHGDCVLKLFSDK